MWIALSLATSVAAPARAETRALLIGVSRYGTPAIQDLQGPANDLPAMEVLIRRIGAQDVVTLRDDAVSRSSVEAALQQIGLRSQPGDWVFLYFSGHGAQARKAERSETDGDLDQFVPLPGFDIERPDPERFIVDKDFYVWLKRYLPDSVLVLMVVDTCHSGTMHRAINLKSSAFTSRLAFRDIGREFRLPAWPDPKLPPLLASSVETGGVEREYLPNLIYIGASRDDQLALEAELPTWGAPVRGVLSYAFEQGLSTPRDNGAELAADLDSDGVVTVAEISSYLNSQVRMFTAQRQDSTASFPSAFAVTALFSSLPPPQRHLGEFLPSVHIAGAGAAVTFPRDQPWRLADGPDHADFIWNKDEAVVSRRTGDDIATGVTTITALNGVIEKWNAIEALIPLVSEINIRMLVGPDGSDVLYGPDELVTLELSQPEDAARKGRRYATVFNLASDGMVEFLYPLEGDGEGVLPANGTLSVLETLVVPPFGVDHVVAVATPEIPEQLRALLRGTDGQRAAERLTGAIRAELKGARGRGSLSIAELYTGE